MRFVTVLAAAAAFAATPAFAQDADAGQEHTGFKVVAIGGGSIVNSGVVDGNGFIYGGSVGYDFDLGSVIGGVEGEVTFNSAEFNAVGGRVEGGRDLYFGGRVGVPVADATFIYAKAGYSNARIRAVAGSLAATADLDGVRGGVGVETGKGNWLARVEYRYSNYEADLDSHGLVLGIGYRF